MPTSPSEDPKKKVKVAVRLLPDSYNRLRDATAEAGFGHNVSLFAMVLLQDILPDIQKLKTVNGFSSPDVREARKTYTLHLTHDIMYKYSGESHRLHLTRRADIVEAALLLAIAKRQPRGALAGTTRDGTVLTVKPNLTTSN